MCSDEVLLTLFKEQSSGRRKNALLHSSVPSYTLHSERVSGQPRHYFPSHFPDTWCSAKTSTCVFGQKLGDTMLSSAREGRSDVISPRCSRHQHPSLKMHQIILEAVEMQSPCPCSQSLCTRRRITVYALSMTL